MLRNRALDRRLPFRDGDGKGESPRFEPVREDFVADAERTAIAASVARHPNDLAAVARELGVSGTTLWRKMPTRSCEATVVRWRWMAAVARGIAVEKPTEYSVP